MKINLIILPLLFVWTIAFSQYPPAAGLSGSTAIYADSSVFVNWAKSCTVKRGYYDISHPTDSIVSNGTEADAFGKADANTVSLGDSGIAVVSFNPPIINGSGFDFAVFENSFDGQFLELAFVEVSSDSIHWYRFDAISLTQTDTQIPTFGTLDPTKINNLAGKYRALYGTPFDLQELSGKPFLNLDSICFVKVIDVIGCILDQYATYDSQGNKINDPWTTPFPTGGFDLDAIGVIHERTQNVPIESINIISVGPNPCVDYLEAEVPGCGKFDVVSFSGEVVISGIYCDRININTSQLNSGLYSLRISSGNKTGLSKFVKK